ncbi:hypothetical protein KAF25_005917 [Fusarium avenaceum]|uniref:Uncharacterized protein n=1 Tax=Fusarium avenaceum TaxID=40199 RepID=A0A9P7GW55_9HYPO|nr:hypothetical protein KAF25_005917 [Fusarium avenaceum]
MPSFSHAKDDVERQGNLLSSKNVPDLQERAGQGCFICLDSHNQGQYAVLVPCLRPIKSRQIMRHIKDCTGKSTLIYEEDSPWDSACESDYEIYHRLLDTCYRHLGRWKRWLPYYGITEVLEVKFQFAGIVESDGRYPIYMDAISLKDISQECEKTIARHPTGPYSDIDDACLGGSEHSDQCIIGMQEWSQPCIKIEAEEAERRRKRLLFLSHLKDCARDPTKANGLHSLKGLAQESCIYDIKYVCSFHPIRGSNQILTYSGVLTKSLCLFHIKSFKVQRG